MWATCGKQRESQVWSLVPTGRWRQFGRPGTCNMQVRRLWHEFREAGERVRMYICECRETRKRVCYKLGASWCTAALGLQKATAPWKALAMQCKATIFWEAPAVQHKEVTHRETQRAFVVYHSCGTAKGPQAAVQRKDLPHPSNMVQRGFLVCCSSAEAHNLQFKAQPSRMVQQGFLPQ